MASESQDEQIRQVREPSLETEVFFSSPSLLPVPCVCLSVSALTPDLECNSPGFATDPLGSFYARICAFHLPFPLFFSFSFLHFSISSSVKSPSTLIPLNLLVSLMYWKRSRVVIGSERSVRTGLGFHFDSWFCKPFAFNK